MKEAEMLVWAYCKDSGGTAGVLPVVHELRRRGVTVRVFAEGVAQKMCASEGVRYEFVSLEELVREETLPRLLITSMCSGGGLGRDLVPYLRPRGVWCVALQDFWGARLMTDWADEKYRPHDIVVNDVVGRELVERAWQDATGIIVAGYPALDRLAVNHVAEKERLRAQFSIPRDARIVLFGGQVKGTSAVLAEVVTAVTQIGNCLFLPRRHPRLLTDAPEDAKRWDAIVETMPRTTHLSQLGALRTEKALAIADVAVAAFSTILVEAAVMRKSVIAVLMRETGGAEFQRQMGDLVHEHPLVSLGCAAKATSAAELNECLTQALAGNPHRAAQESTFRVDGKNATRLTNLLMAQLAGA